MNVQQERRMGDLVERILQLTDQLPTLLDAPPAEDDEASSQFFEDLETFEGLDDAATALWKLWREAQVEKDLATCR